MARTGRPTKAAKPGTKASLGLKVTAAIKARLEKEASTNGRTQSQEAEVRIERSFERQSLLAEVLSLKYGRKTARLVLVVAEAADMALEAFGIMAVQANVQPPSAAAIRSDEDWLGDPYA